MFHSLFVFPRLVKFSRAHRNWRTKLPQWLLKTVQKVSFFKAILIRF